MYGLRTFPVFLGFLLLTSVTVHSGGIAVLPVSDMSKGPNSVNMMATKLICERLRSVGFNVVPEDKVISFMIRHRIRWVGYLDSLSLVELGKETGADMALIGTITQFGGPAGSIGMTVRVVRLRDGRSVWSFTYATSLEGKRRVLGIGNIKNLDTLLKEVVSRVVLSVPKGFAGEAFLNTACDVDDVSVFPKFVRSGEKVFCRVGIKCIGSLPDQVVFDVGCDRKILASRVEDRGVYGASWQAPGTEGRFPITLTLLWDGGKKKHVGFVSSYWVDDTPPRFSLRVRKGIKLGSSIAFKDHVFLVPVFKKPEPISGWLIEVKNEKGITILREHGEGNVPKMLVWRGCSGDGKRLLSGRFVVTLRVWDRAGNQASSSRNLILSRLPPEVSLSAMRRGGVVELRVDLSGSLVPVEFWRVEVLGKDGKVLGEAEGTGLPAVVRVPFKGSSNVFFCNFEARDLLGNVSRVEKERVVAVSSRVKKRREKGRWLDEF